MVGGGGWERRCFPPPGFVSSLLSSVHRCLLLGPHIWSCFSPLKYFSFFTPPCPFYWLLSDYGPKRLWDTSLDLIPNFLVQANRRMNKKNNRQITLSGHRFPSFIMRYRYLFLQRSAHIWLVRALLPARVAHVLMKRN